MGDACPIPVVKTLRALKELNGAGTVQTLVDNRAAVENLTRLAESKGCAVETEQLGEKEYRVTITAGEDAELPESADGICTVPAAADNTVVAVSAGHHMGEGGGGAVPACRSAGAVQLLRVQLGGRGGHGHSGGKGTGTEQIGKRHPRSGMPFPYSCRPRSVTTAETRMSCVSCGISGHKSLSRHSSSASPVYRARNRS